MHHAPDTSAGIPQRIDDVVKGVDALDEDTRMHLAQRVAASAGGASRIGAILVVTPVAGCTALTVAAPTVAELTISIAMALLVVGLPVTLIVRGMARRAIRDEVRLLGYDDATQKLVLKTWRHGARWQLRATAEHAVKEALDELQAGAG